MGSQMDIVLLRILWVHHIAVTIINWRTVRRMSLNIGNVEQDFVMLRDILAHKCVVFISGLIAAATITCRGDRHGPPDKHNVWIIGFQVLDIVSQPLKQLRRRFAVVLIQMPILHHSDIDPTAIQSDMIRKIVPFVPRIVVAQHAPSYDPTIGVKPFWSGQINTVAAVIGFDNCQVVPAGIDLIA